MGGLWKKTKKNVEIQFPSSDFKPFDKADNSI